MKNVTVEGFFVGGGGEGGRHSFDMGHGGMINALPTVSSTIVL